MDYLLTVSHTSDYKPSATYQGRSRFWKSEGGKWKSEIGNRKSEGGKWKVEVGRWKGEALRKDGEIEIPDKYLLHEARCYNGTIPH